MSMQRKRGSVKNAGQMKNYVLFSEGHDKTIKYIKNASLPPIKIKPINNLKQILTAVSDHIEFVLASLLNRRAKRLLLLPAMLLLMMQGAAWGQTAGPDNAGTAMKTIQQVSERYPG